MQQTIKTIAIAIALNSLLPICLLPILSMAQTPNIIDTYLGGMPTKTIIAKSSDGILVPRDLDFHPTRDELWVVLKSTESVGGKTVLIKKPGQPGQTELVQKDGNAWHFMSLPTGIAFSPNGNFATSPGIFDANHNGGSPFTGPALWSSNPLIYAQPPPPGGNGSHLDMLHESPYSMGIASDVNNVFWVNDGYNNTVVRYDFKTPHSIGGSLHADGVVRRYTGLGLKEDPAHHVVSSLILDKATGWLYIADTGNKRVVRLNTATGSKTGNFTPYESIAEASIYTGYSSNVYISSGLVTPSGIDIVDNRMIVSDYSNGEIVVYDISGTTGKELGRLQTGSTGIMGLKIGPDGKIWYVNATTNEVVKLETGNGINENADELNAYVYPNPVQDKLMISYTTDLLINSTISLHTILGEEVLKIKNEHSNQTELNLSQFLNGIYFLNINSNSGNAVKKIIISK